jgi:glycosyltransferase involved in cell wall biosynthesis
MTRPRLSVCLITKDEERFLADCLESVRGVADGIVLVDTGSTDGTLEIARHFGCTVLHQPWTDDFSRARNAGIEAATGDWVLAIDADERLVDAGGVARAMAEAPPEVGAFLVERHDVVRHADTGRTERYPIGIVRLFRRHPAIRYVGAAHERPGETVLAAGFRIESTHAFRIAHLVSDRPDDELERKQRRYLAILEREIAAAPLDFWARYYRAKTLWYLKHLDDADAAFRAIADDGRCAAPMRASALNMLGALWLERGRPEDTLRRVEASVRVFPLQSLALYLRGEALYRLGRFDEAAEAYGRVRVSLDPEVVTEWVPGDLYLPRGTKAFKLGSCFLATGDLPRALAAFRAGMDAEPEDAACWFGAASVAWTAGERALALSLLDAARARDPGWREPRELRERWREEEGRDAEAGGGP